MEKSITSAQIDALREIMTIGAGNAATALSSLLKRRVDIAVPSVHLRNISDFTEIFGGAESAISAVYMRLSEGISGAMMMTFDYKTVISLADILSGRAPGSSSSCDEVGISSIKETMSIISGSYLIAISKIVNFQVMQSVPEYASDMAGALSDVILVELCRDVDNILVVDTEFSIKGEKLQTYFLFMPDAESFKNIMVALGVEGTT